MSNASVFDLQRIRDESFVQELDFHWELASTNSHALERAEQSDPQLPLLVLTEQQTQGRGRGQNVWWSAAGSLTFSLVLELADLPQNQIPGISLTTGLAMCRAMESLAPLADVGLKWPNDVYLDDKKLAGILIERSARRPTRIVIGIGMNVNNSMQDAPPEVAERSISLCDASDEDWNLNDVLIAILQELEQCWIKFRQDPRGLLDQWRAYDLLLGRDVEVDIYDGTVQGRAAGIDSDGALLIDAGKGQQRCLGGVVRFFSK